MKRLMITCAVLAGCTPVSSPVDDPELPVIRPYRGEADPCKFVGESSVTVDYLDDAADLVACPSDYDGLADFIVQTGGTEMGQYKNFTLISVPYR